MKVRSRVAGVAVSIAGFDSGEESEASNVLIDVDDAARIRRLLYDSLCRCRARKDAGTGTQTSVLRIR